MRWAVYYDTKLPAEQFADLDLVVFDGRYHPDLKPLKGGKTIVLGYISLGEVHGDVPEKKTLKKANAILHKNSAWDSYVVDLASPKWKEIVLKNVDTLAEKGFDGVMLDTVDSPLEWARKASPERHIAMQQEAADLIHMIRVAHPKMKIMLNRGFILLPKAGPDIDYVLAESILSQKDNISGQFSLFPPERYADAVAQLRQSVSSTGHLRLFTLDYWDVTDVQGLERIYSVQRAAGFSPYVTTQDLRQYTPEPARSFDLAHNKSSSL